MVLSNISSHPKNYPVPACWLLTVVLENTQPQVALVISRILSQTGWVWLAWNGKLHIDALPD